MRAWMSGVSGDCRQHQLLRRGVVSLIVMLAMLQSACGGGGGEVEGGDAATTTGTSQVQRQALVETPTALFSSPNAQSKTLQVRATLPSAAPSLTVAMDDLEAVGPFASWGDVKRDYGAKGDGVADDTAALQKALDDLGWKVPAVYLPAGRYRITRSLKVTGSPSGGTTGFGLGGVSIVGDSAATTTLVWAGASGEPMLVHDGGTMTKYSRITWDGQGTAGYGVAQWWNAKAGTWHDSGTEHSDAVFKNMRIGIMAGRLGANYGEMGSEGQVRRVKFINITDAGLTTGSFNAMNWWVWDSQFTDCGRGVTNIFTVADTPGQPGAGSMHVYRSLFERSKVADMHIANTGFFSMHQNVSVGSRRFFQGEEAGGNGASILFKGNRVLDTTEPAAIQNGNLGPLVLIDNEVRSLATATAAAVRLTNFSDGRDLISIGNKYTVSPSIQQRNQTDRVLSIDDQVVARSTIASTLPSLPGAAVRHTRQVFEVPPGSSERMIQAIVNLAAQSGADNPIVHFAKGEYRLASTIVVPALTRLQLVGDGLTTQVRWTGPAGGIMFQLDGPSRATVRDMFLLGNGPTAKAFSLPNADQAQGRVLVLGSSLPTLQAVNLTQTHLSLQGNPSLNGLNLNNAQSVISVGAGGIGPSVIGGNSRALVQDQWYEGNQTALFRVSSGDFTYMSGHMSPASHPGIYDPTQPPVSLDGLNGKVTFVSFSFDNNAKTQGISLQVKNETAATQALFLAPASLATNYFQRTGSGGSVGMVMGRGRNEAGAMLQLGAVGRSDAAFIRSQLLSARGVVWDTAPRTARATATDVRIYRVHASNAVSGMTISGN
jgi:hypothetical protein